MKKNPIEKGMAVDLSGVEVHTSVSEQSTQDTGPPTRRVFSSFQHPAFRLYWIAVLAQMASMNTEMISRAWLVYDLTGSTAMLGAIFMASAMPMVFLSVFGGILADRVQKKYILVIGQAASAATAFAIGLTLSLGLMTEAGDVIYLLIASILQGVILALVLPSRQAIIAELVSRERLMNAIALHSVAMNINRLLVPGIAGLLIALIGIAGVYYFMTALNIVAGFLILPIPLTTTLKMGRTTGTLSELKDGLSYIRRNPVIFHLLVLSLLMVTLSMPYLFMLPVFAKDILVVRATEMLWLTELPLIGGWLTALPDLFAKDSFRLGLLVSVSGVGAVAASLFIASLKNRNRGNLFLLNGLFLGLALVAFSFTDWYLLALLFMIAVGLGHAGRLTFSNTLIQSVVEDSYRGRVTAIFVMEWGLTSLGVFAVSLVAEVVGVPWAVGGAAGLLALISLYCFFFTPTICHLQ